MAAYWEERVAAHPRVRANRLPRRTHRAEWPGIVAGYKNCGAAFVLAHNRVRSNGPQHETKVVHDGHRLALATS